MKSLSKHVEMTHEEALILQHISESGEEDIVGLVRGLRMSRSRVMQALTHLKHKGLITIKATYGDWWVRTSARGTHLVRYMWPELSMNY